MNFASWVSTVCTTLGITTQPLTGGGPSGDASFNTIYPAAIDYTELRIQRDLDLLGTSVTDETGALTVNNRKFSLPTSVGAYIVAEELYLIIGGVRQKPLLRVARAALDSIWPSDTATTVPSIPTMWAEYDQTTVLVAPPPDFAYGAGVVGEQRVAELSPTNATNLLSTLFPDLYVAASLVWLSGYQRDFGAQSEDPKMAMSWEQTYQTLLDGAEIEEARKRFMGPGWTPRPPAKIATPPQT